MTENLPYFFVIILYCLSFYVDVINSKTSSLWKLNNDKTKIVEGGQLQEIASFPNVQDAKVVQFVVDDDPVFNIITSTRNFREKWVKEGVDYICTSCQVLQKDERNKSFVQSDSVSYSRHEEESLDCGKPVNFTYYDNLIGVLNRNSHPNIPDLQAALSFSKNKAVAFIKSFDVDALEKRLMKIKREKPKSIQLYNQIGNFWRIKGDSKKAIECFRRALAVSPHNPEILLNLARLLFTLQYLDDAIFLTRRSLELQPQDKTIWQQYFTLGEIFKAYGHYQEASIHLRRALELKPGFEPAYKALEEIDTLTVESMHVYTLLIIICLVLGVLLVISSADNNCPHENDCELKFPKQMSKPLAMRLRGLHAAQKYTRLKKLS